MREALPAGGAWGGSSRASLRRGRAKMRVQVCRNAEGNASDEVRRREETMIERTKERKVTK